MLIQVKTKDWPIFCFYFAFYSEKHSEIEIQPEDAVYESFQNLSDDSDSLNEFQLWLRQKIDNVIANGYPKDEIEIFFAKNLEKLEKTRPSTTEILKMILVKRRKKESDNIAKNLLATRFELQNPQYDNNKSWFVCYIIYKSLLRTRHLWIINYAFWIYRVVRGLSRWCIPICMLPNFKGQISPIKSRYHINLKARCCFEMVITYDAQGSTRHPSYQSTQSYSKLYFISSKL